MHSGAILGLGSPVKYYSRKERKLWAKLISQLFAELPLSADFGDVSQENLECSLLLECGLLFETAHKALDDLKFTEELIDDVEALPDDFPSDLMRLVYDEVKHVLDRFATSRLGQPTVRYHRLSSGDPATTILWSSPHPAYTGDWVALQYKVGEARVTGRLQNRYYAFPIQGSPFSSDLLFSALDALVATTPSPPSNAVLISDLDTLKDHCYPCTLQAMGLGSAFSSSVLSLITSLQPDLIAACLVRLRDFHLSHRLESIEQICEAVGLHPTLSIRMRKIFARPISSHETYFNWLSAHIRRYKGGVGQDCTPSGKPGDQNKAEGPSGPPIPVVYVDFTVAEDSTTQNLGKFSKAVCSLPPNRQYWYHGTSRASAGHIVRNGINPPGGDTHDFGVEPAFYVGNLLSKAIDWALRRGGDGNMSSAILVFDLTDTSAPYTVTVEEWPFLIRDSRSNTRDGHVSQIPALRDNNGFVQGSLCSNSSKVCDLQLCQSCAPQLCRQNQHLSCERTNCPLGCHFCDFCSDHCNPVCHVPTILPGDDDNNPFQQRSAHGNAAWRTMRNNLVGIVLF